MHKHRDITQSRIEQFKDKENLKNRKLLFPKQLEKVDITSWPAPDRVSFSEAVKHLDDFKPLKVGGLSSLSFFLRDFFLLLFSLFFFF